MYHRYNDRPDKDGITTTLALVPGILYTGTTNPVITVISKLVDD